MEEEGGYEGGYVEGRDGGRESERGRVVREELEGSLRVSSFVRYLVRGFFGFWAVIFALKPTHHHTPRIHPHHAPHTSRPNSRLALVAARTRLPVV